MPEELHREDPSFAVAHGRFLGMLRMAVALVWISTSIAIGSSMIHDHSILKVINLHERDDVQKWC